MASYHSGMDGANSPDSRGGLGGHDSVVHSRFAFIPPPAQLVAPPFRRGHNVWPAVAIQVSHDHLVGAYPAIFEKLPIPGTGNDFDLTVVVQVSGNRFEGVGRDSQPVGFLLSSGKVSDREVEDVHSSPLDDCHASENSAWERIKGG